MSGISFEKDAPQAPASAGAPAADANPTAETTQTAPASSVPAVREESPHEIFDDNNIGFEDIRLPRINIVQKVGELSEAFTAGEIVLDQSHVLWSLPKQGEKKSPPLNMVVIGFKRTVFIEKVEGGKMGLTCRTREDVVKCGGTLDYKEWEESVKQNKANPAVKALRRFDNMTTALVLIEQPASVPDENHVIFPYECNGKYYVMAFFTMKSSAYNAGAKAIFTFRKQKSITNPKVSYADNYFTLETEMKKFGTGNTTPIPDIRPAAPTTPEMAKLVKLIKGVE